MAFGVDYAQQLIDAVGKGANKGKKAQDKRAKAESKAPSASTGSARVGGGGKAGAGKYLDVGRSEGTGWSYVNPQGRLATNVSAPKQWENVHTTEGKRRFGTLGRDVGSGMSYGGLHDAAKRKLVGVAPMGAWDWRTPSGVNAPVVIDGTWIDSSTYEPVPADHPRAMAASSLGQSTGPIADLQSGIGNHFRELFSPQAGAERANQYGMWGGMMQDPALQYAAVAHPGGWPWRAAPVF